MKHSPLQVGLGRYNIGNGNWKFEFRLNWDRIKNWKLGLGIGFGIGLEVGKWD